MASDTTASYRVRLSDDGKGPCLSYWCMRPGTSLLELQSAGVRSIVLTSGTLSPMDSFAHELVRIFFIGVALLACSLTHVCSISPSPSGWRTNMSSSHLRYAQ